ncbi:Arc/MetJ family transcription regulator [Actinoalloteichus hoggarensis]|uniref:Uncharacterized protein n=1 Tax=Actinoalloteichus hoggarensis TaxID=1470176 RepID=A0A221VW84_9PSEU|nr:hypothetical protein [Actinoalloteichus hoggarensis]ASO17773.1 hypothetical protein AHOG_00500 [Actinoalloteichus hoggarensis]MBB5922900.1 Arc/MetJ family transcription regulator [Actinoalloteichus hoggarensis]
MTDIDDEMLAMAGLRLGTVTVDETVNVALRLAAGLPAEDRGEEPAACTFRLAEDVLAESAREQCRSDAERVTGARTGSRAAAHSRRTRRCR